MNVIPAYPGRPKASRFQRLSGGAGPTDAHRIEVDFLEPNLRRAACFSLSMYGIGNGRYTEARSLLAPMLVDLRENQRINEAQANDLLERLEELPPSKWIKYRGPLRELRKKLREIRYSLRGTESPQNLANREAFAAFLSELPREKELLDSGEVRIVAAYKDAGGYQELNRALRGQQALTEALRVYAEALCLGLAKLPPYGKVVYRGAGCLIGGVKEASIGAVYKEPGFLSTSETPQKAFDCEYRIAIMPSRSFFDISDIYDADDCSSINIAHFEGEVLGLSGTSLMYDGVHNGFHWYHEVEPASGTCG